MDAKTYTCFEIKDYYDGPLSGLCRDTEGEEYFFLANEDNYHKYNIYNNDDVNEEDEIDYYEQEPVDIIIGNDMNFEKGCFD